MIPLNKIIDRIQAHERGDFGFTFPSHTEKNIHPLEKAFSEAFKISKITISGTEELRYYTEAQIEALSKAISKAPCFTTLELFICNNPSKEEKEALCILLNRLRAPTFTTLVLRSSRYYSWDRVDVEQVCESLAKSESFNTLILCHVIESWQAKEIEERLSSILDGRVTTFGFREWRGDTEKTQALGKALKQARTVTSLQFFDATTFTTELSEAIMQAPNLTELTFSESHSTLDHRKKHFHTKAPGHIQEFCQNLAKIPKLTTLKLNGDGPWNADAVLTLCEAFSDSPKPTLKSLHLSYISVGFWKYSDIAHFSKVLPTISTLTELDLSSNQLRDALIKDDPDPHSFKNVPITECDAILRFFAQSFSNLTTLNLGDNLLEWLDKEKFTVFCNALESNRTLTNIKYDDTRKSQDDCDRWYPHMVKLKEIAARNRKDIITKKSDSFVSKQSSVETKVLQEAASSERKITADSGQDNASKALGKESGNKIDNASKESGLSVSRYTPGVGAGAGAVAADTKTLQDSAGAERKITADLGHNASKTLGFSFSSYSPKPGDTKGLQESVDTERKKIGDVPDNSKQDKSFLMTSLVSFSQDYSLLSEDEISFILQLADNTSTDKASAFQQFKKS